MPFPSANPRAEQLLRGILTNRTYDVARETALDPVARLFARVGAEVLLKREDFQPVFCGVLTTRSRTWRLTEGPALE